jgi:hypothetical protein
MNGFRPSLEGGDEWGKLYIGIDYNPVEFVENVSQEAGKQKF